MNELNDLIKRKSIIEQQISLTQDIKEYNELNVKLSLLSYKIVCIENRQKSKPNIKTYTAPNNLKQY